MSSTPVILVKPHKGDAIFISFWWENSHFHTSLSTGYLNKMYSTVCIYINIIYNLHSVANDNHDNHVAYMTNGVDDK